MADLYASLVGDHFFLGFLACAFVVGIGIGLSDLSK